MDPGKAPRHAMYMEELEYPDWEYDQQQNGERAATEGAMTMKTLSIKLTRDYPKVTKRKQSASPIFCNTDTASVIPGRPNAKKWETTMAAVAQIMAFLKPGEIGEPNTLIFPAVLYDTDKRELERKEMDDFNKRDSKFLTLEVIHGLETVWHVWKTTIDHASAIGAQVYQKKFYGPPNSIPWIEFIGIAVIVTNHYLVYGQHHDLDTYAMTWVLSDVSRLRRWLRCKFKSDGFRRNDADWKVCWDIIEPGAHDKEIPRVSVFKESKTNQPFVFEDEPELFLPHEGNPESVVQNSEDVDVLMAGSKEVEEDEGEDRWEENLHPKLRGVVTGPVVVEKHDLIGSTSDIKKAEARRGAWGWLQPREPAEPSNRFYPVDDTQFYR
jgi:hypothetical protein